MDLGMNVVTKDDWTTPRTGAVCLVVAYVFYVIRLINHLYFDQIEAMLRKVTGLKSGEDKSSRQPIQLGPHSYKPLIFSLLSCTVWLAIIWLIRITPFEKLYKNSPLYKLVKILLNSPDLELEEDDKVVRGSPEQTAKHQQILNTCTDLERRMSQLERCLTPLARSLQTLTEVIEGRGEPAPVDPRESQVVERQESGDHQQSRVMDLLAQIADHVDSEDTDRPDGSLHKSHSDSKVLDRLYTKVKDRPDHQIPNPAGSQVTDNPVPADILEFRVKSGLEPRTKVVSSKTSDLPGQTS